MEPNQQNEGNTAQFKDTSVSMPQMPVVTSNSEICPAQGSDAIEDISILEESTPMKESHNEDKKEGISICDDWDEAAGIPSIHFSFIVNLVLPKHVVARRDPKVKSEIEKINVRGRQQFGGEDPPSKYIPVGSAAECYQIPRVISKKPSAIPEGVEYSDIDVLVAWNIRQIKELDHSTEVKQKLILETDGSHPGYCTLFINDPESVLKGVDPSTAIYVENRCFYSAKKVRDDVKMLMRDTALQQKINAAKIIVDQQGPAVGVEDMTQRTLKVFLENTRMEHPRQEFVAALPIIWPTVAIEWKTRPRCNQWLTESLIESIVQDGCHVVAVPHRNSKHLDIEWRLSFATSEVRLANEVVNDDQRQCYVYLKLLRQERLKGLDLLSSYHFKTAFLYSCERIPVPCWSNNQGGCILYVLDTLIQYVKNRWLPSYFIPENNLLDHLTSDEFEHLEVLLTAIRTDPISPILEFTDENIIASQSAVTPFRTFVGPVIDDFRRYEIHRNKRESTKEFIQALTSFIFALFLDDKVEDVVSYVGDLYSFFQKYIPAESFSQYLYPFTTLWKIVTQCIKYFETAIEKYATVYPDVQDVRGNLGCLYHVFSYHHPFSSNMYKDSISKADSYFKQYLEEKGVGTPVTINYALLLIQMGMKERCINLLRAFVGKQDANQTFHNVFNVMTIVTLENSLRKELSNIIQDSKIVTLPTQALAYYLLVHVEFHERGNSTAVTTLLDKFQDYTVQTNTCWCHYLLGLSLSLVKSWAKAEHAFHAANSITETLFSGLKEKACHLEYLLAEEKLSEATMYVTNNASKSFGLTCAGLVHALAFKLNTAKSAVEFADAVFSSMEDDPEVQTFHGNLACLHFASAFEYPDEPEERLTAIVKAETLFCTYLSESQHQQSATVVDYAAFLYSQERWSEAKDILETFLRNPSKESYNTYSTMEYLTLDDTLKKEVDLHTKIKAPSISFAYFFLIKCLISLGESEQNIKTTKSRFTQFCETSKNGRSYSLLGYTEMYNENWFRAEHWFCKAVERDWDYTCAKQNIALCRSKRSIIVEDKYEEKYSPLCIVPELRAVI